MKEASFAKLRPIETKLGLLILYGNLYMFMRSKVIHVYKGCKMG